VIDPDEITETETETVEATDEKVAPVKRRARRPSRSYVDLPAFGGTMWTHPDDR
jgi:hypothetical protein